MNSRLNPADEIKLTGIFRTLFNDPELRLGDELTASDVPGWDSFNHINLVMYIEEEFAIQFTTREIAGLKNVGEFKVLIAGKLSR